MPEIYGDRGTDGSEIGTSASRTAWLQDSRKEVQLSQHRKESGQPYGVYHADCLALRANTAGNLDQYTAKAEARQRIPLVVSGSMRIWGQETR